MGKARSTKAAAARRRAAQIRIEQQRHARRRRQAVIYGVVAATLALAVGIAFAVQRATAPKTPNLVPISSAADTTGGLLAADAMAIPIGRSDAPVTLTVYDDFRCTACRAFHTLYQPALDELVTAGKLKILVHPVTLVDSNLAGTSGSLHAGNAAACAQDAGHFAAYRDLLYARQPTEGNDAYASNQTLITLAKQVPGLDTSAFESCVNSTRYGPWVKRNHANLVQISGNQVSTPTLYLNGRRYVPSDAPTEAAARAALVTAVETLAAASHPTASAP